MSNMLPCDSEIKQNTNGTIRAARVSKRCLLMIFCLANIFSMYCFAGNRPDAYTFTVAGAYYHFSPKRHVNNTSMPNLALAYNLNEHWGIEGSVGVINTDYHHGPGAHGFLYMIDGVYRFKPYKYFEPYAIAGIGILGLRPQIQTTDPEHQSNINAGVGTQFFADESVALRVEVRDVYTLSGGKNDWMANFGVSFLFGK